MDYNKIIGITILIITAILLIFRVFGLIDYPVWLLTIGVWFGLALAIVAIILFFVWWGFDSVTKCKCKR